MAVFIHASVFAGFFAWPVLFRFCFIINTLTAHNKHIVEMSCSQNIPLSCFRLLQTFCKKLPECDAVIIVKQIA